MFSSGSRCSGMTSYHGFHHTHILFIKGSQDNFLTKGPWLVLEMKSKLSSQKTLLDKARAGNGLNPFSTSLGETGGKGAGQNI